MLLSRRPTLPSIHSLDLPFMAPSYSSAFSSSPFFSNYRQPSSEDGSEDWEASRSPSPASSLCSSSSSSSAYSRSSSSSPDPCPLEPTFSRLGSSSYDPPSLHTHASSASLRSTSSTSSYGSTKLRLAPCALTDLDAVILVPSSPPSSPTFPSLSPTYPTTSAHISNQATSPYTPDQDHAPNEGKAKPLLLTGPAAQAFKHPSALKALGRVRVHPYRIVGGSVGRRASVATTGGLSEHDEMGRRRRRSEGGMGALMEALRKV